MEKNNVKKELVIAKYARSCDWIKKINSDVKVTIYNKNKDTLSDGEILIEPNVGLNDHTFFYHIVNNYEKLADLTFFSQDYPFDHVPNFIDIVNNESLIQKHVFKSGDGYYVTAETTKERPSLQPIMYCYKDGSPHHKVLKLDIDRAWKYIFKKSNLPYKYDIVHNGNEIIFKEKPFLYAFIPGTHYVVTKEKVYQKDINFYKRILDYLASGIRSTPYEIERLYPFIYHKNYT